jgi:uncharacterized protein
LVRFRFDDALAPFLAHGLRGRAFEHRPARAANLKNAIEALGVPHTEVGRLAVNGAPATLQRIVRDNDDVEVFAWQSQATLGDEPQFVADAHLGGLARLLRMLGFDTLHDPGIHDAEIRRLAGAERRIVLTRDRELLKCSDIVQGAYVRALKPDAQLLEVCARFGLAGRARPFALCLHCNARLEPAAKEAVADRLPQKVAERQHDFMRCPACDRVYWRGTHYERMQEKIQALLRPCLTASASLRTPA